MSRESKKRLKGKAFGSSSILPVGPTHPVLLDINRRLDIFQDPQHVAIRNAQLQGDCAGRDLVVAAKDRHHRTVICDEGQRW